MTAHLHFAAYTLERGRGGVCQVARMMQRTIEQMVDAGELKASYLTMQHDKGQRSKAGFLFANFLHATKATHCLYDSANMARAHAAIPKRPYICFMHGIEVWEQARPCWIQACRQADLLLVNSAFTRTRASALHTGLDKAQVCWLGTEEDEAAPRGTPLNERPPEAMIVARMDPAEAYKGHRELIAAWPQVLAEIPDAVLHVVGRGDDQPALARLAADHGVDQATRFHGFVPDAELDAWYRRIRLSVMPSRGEGFGLVYLDAMRRGLPVIASSHDAASEVVVDQETGLLVNLDQPDTLPAALISLLGNSERATCMGEAGRARWQQHFRRSCFEQRFATHLRAFLGSPQR